MYNSEQSIKTSGLAIFECLSSYYVQKIMRDAMSSRDLAFIGNFSLSHKLCTTQVVRDICHSMGIQKSLLIVKSRIREASWRK